MQSLTYDDLVEFCNHISPGLHLRHVDLGELQSLADIFGSKRCQLSNPHQLALVLPSYDCVSEFVESFKLSNQQRDVVQGIVDFYSEGILGRMELKRKFTPVPIEETPSFSIPVPKCNPLRKASNQAKKLLRLLFNEVAPKRGVMPTTSVPKVSRQAKEDEYRARTLDNCMAVFERLGEQSPRYVRLFGTAGKGRRSPTEAEMDLHRKCFFTRNKRHVSTETVDGYRKDFIHFLAWVDPLGIPLEEVSTFQVAAYIHNQRSLGKTVPTRRLYALKWAEEWSEIAFHTNNPLVATQTSDGAVASEPPKKAKCPSMLMIMAFEEYVCDTSKPVVLRVYAGVCLALVHGTLRWSDFQRTVELHLGEHVLYGKSIMKRRRTLTPWAATRIGFSGLDWGSTFFILLQEHGMPCGDFVVLGYVAYNKFRDAPATFSTMLNTMRLILVKSLGMSPEEAVEYSLHSWRHWYPTAGKQLRLPDEQNVAMGHWSHGSNMPSTYDANINSLELAAKQHIVRMVHKHKFDLQPEGSFPLAPLVPSEVSSQGMEPERSSNSSGKAPMTPPMEEPNPGGLPDLPADHSPNTKGKRASGLAEDPSENVPVQVQNKTSKKIHLYLQGFHTVCTTWRCGTREEPRHSADFQQSFDSLDVNENFLVLCQVCYGDTRKFASHLKIPSYYEVAELQPELSSCQETDSAGDCESDASEPEEVALSVSDPRDI